MADAGVASRRASEKLIEQKRVTVNGRPATIGMKINPSKDIIAVDGNRIASAPKQRSPRVTVMLYKPRGYVTTMQDEMGRRCVSSLVDDIPGRLYPVGRLDKNSEGLLLMTNDGELANMLMHPSRHIPRRYRVTVQGEMNDEQLIRLSEGVEIDSGMTQPAVIHVVDKTPTRSVMEMTIYEGKNRQIRKMCEVVNLEVIRLKRIALGPLKLGMLKPGRYRKLTGEELRALRNAAAKSGGVKRD